MKTHKINIILFALVIFSLATVNILNTNKPKISITEKRILKPMPEFSLHSLTEGEFLKDFDEHFADTFVFRDNFVEISKNLNKCRGLNSNDDIKIAESYGDNTFASPNSNEYDKVDVNIKNEDPVTILFKDNRALSIHKFYPEKAKNYANAINKFANKLSEDIKVYSIIVPDQIEFIKDERFKSMSDSEAFTLEYVYSYFGDRVIPINIYESLKKNSDKYLYFNTDHHWTALGAYYGYTSFIKALGENPEPLSAYDIIEFENYLGSRYPLNEDLAQNPDTVQVFRHKNINEFEYYINNEGEYRKSDLLNMSYKDKENKYGAFLGGDSPLSKIISSNKNQKKILVIKDSFGNAFVPFLAPHYEEVYIVDPRYIDQSVYQLIEQNNIDEVLFLNTISVTTKHNFPKILEKLSIQ